MSTNDNCNDHLSRTVPSSLKPFSGDMSEYFYSEHSVYNEDRYNMGSTSQMMHSKCYESEISKKLTYEILKRYSNIDPLFKFESNDGITIKNILQKTNSIKIEENLRGGTSVSSLSRRKSIGVQYEVASDTEVPSYHCSRSNSVCNVKASKRFIHRDRGLNHNKSHNTEKRKLPDIQCYPFTNNYYNEELIFKTAERNRRLQKLVKMMTVAREREKQKNAWNNYITELRYKHGYTNSFNRIPIRFVADEEFSPKLIEEFYGTKFNCQNYDDCQNIIKDLYEPCTSSKCNYFENLNSKSYESFNPLFNSSPPVESFPTSPNSHLQLKRDMSNQCGSINYSHNKAENGNTVLMGTHHSQTGGSFKNINKSTVVYKRKIPHVFKNSSIQTQLKLLPVKKQEADMPETNKHFREAEDILKIINIEDVKQERRQESFNTIENKLDILIKSVNTLISEMGANPVPRNSILNNNYRMTISRSVDAVTSPNTENVNERLADIKVKQNLSNNIPNMLPNSDALKLNDIILEEINKNYDAKRYIEDILNGKITQSSGVQITDYIPTRECSTEVTNSLSKTKVCSTEVTQLPSQMKNCSTEVTKSLSKTEVNGSKEEQRNFSEKHRMTMAVNTDPLGLQALLRISKETVKSVLTFIQNFSYQNLLQLPLLRDTDIRRSHFVCSICGAVFITPTLLTEHLQDHVKNRFCCVCRHLTSMQAENPRRVFCCEFCSKPFSRAYCCELHQQTCAKRLGRPRDVTSSLVLLR